MTNDNQHIPTGYKPSPLGIIPEDWEVKTLGECTNLLTNGFVGVATPHYTEDPDGITYIQGFNVTEGGFNLTGIKKVTRAFHKKNSKSSLREGDLLTIQTGDIGLTTIVTKELEGSNCHALIISRFKEMILPQFMLYYYNSPIGRNRFRIIETGTTMKHINTGDLVKFSIPVPSLPEQQRIVSVLSLWDAAIAKQTALIEQLTLRKRGLMQQLLTGKKRLIGFEGEWKEVRLGDIGDTYSGLINKNKDDFEEGNAHYIPYMNVFSNEKVDTNNLGQVKVSVSENQTKVKYGDIFFTVSSETPEEVGMASVLLYDIENTYLNSFCFGYRLNGFETLLPVFASYLLRGNSFRKEMYKIAQGSTRFNISKNEVIDMRIALPSIDEQNAIASVLVNADNEIEIQKQKLAAMQEQKKGLMQVLLTGKKRV